MGFPGFSDAAQELQDYDQFIISLLYNGTCDFCSYQLCEARKISIAMHLNWIYHQDLQSITKIKPFSFWIGKEKHLHRDRSMA